MNIHLHIGTHKTGTTAIQHFAFENRELLARHGVHWPAEQLKPHAHQHSALSLMIVEGRADEAKAYILRALNAAQAGGAHTLLLSGENLCALNAAQVAALVGWFADHSVEVSIYFRNIYDYAVSAFTQTIKVNHRMQGPDRIIEAIQGGLDYSDQIRRWEAVIPADRLHVRSYDQDKADLLPRFFAALGVPEADTRARMPATAKARNDSLDLPTQLLLSAIGHDASSRSYHETRTLYQKLFGGMAFKAQVGPMIAMALCTSARPDLSHPRLAAFQDILTREPKMPEPDEAAMADYLERLSRFTGKLARRKRGGWLARLGLRR